MIDKDLQQSFRNKFNPDGSILRNMQLRLLEMLMYIDDICNNNNIKYWLSSGTCLGAVRHGGFIPWDDDLDIEMERKDYNRLLKILREQPDKYVLQEYKSDCEYLHTYSKLRDLNSRVKENNDSDTRNKYQGIYIDIFPIYPSRSRKLFNLGAALWYKGVYMAQYINDTKKRRKRIKLFRNTFSKLIFPIMETIQLPFNAKIFRHNLGSVFSKPRYRKDIDSTVRIPFEGALLPVPQNYDHYLREIYGDYEKLPDIEEIHPHFIDVSFDK